jgi:Ca2+-binding RTX toxin-like protein
MGTTVTVPGAESTYVPNTYNTPYNLAVAQQISTMLADSQNSNTLFVQNSDQNPGTVPDGYVGEIVDTVPGGGVVDVPAGYTYTAIDQSVTGPVTVNGGGSLFAGNQTVTYYGAPAPSPVYIAVGDGNDDIVLPAGSTYQVGLGNGNDTVDANGSGTVTGGDGNNLFYAGSASGPGGTNEINSYGANDTVVAGAGTVSVDSYGANPLVYGGSGQLVYLGGAPGNPTIAGGTGQETLFGAAGQDITYTDGSSTTTGANIMAAGAGNETLNAGGAQYGVRMAAGSGSVDMIGSTGSDTFFGGSGTATITGNGGSDWLVVGSVPGHTGGTDIFTDFSSNDLFVVCGYGADAAQNALNAATVAGGNTTVRLSDDTTITFLGITNPGTIANRSY